MQVQVVETNGLVRDVSLEQMVTSGVDIGRHVTCEVPVHESMEDALTVATKATPDRVGAASEGGKRRPRRPRKNSSILLRGYASESGVNEVGDGPVTRSKAMSRGLRNAFQILSNEEHNIEC